MSQTKNITEQSMTNLMTIKGNLNASEIEAELINLISYLILRQSFEI